MLPNFLVIGAPKAGTTSLYHYLRLHPQVFMPATKELSFFVEQNNWPRGRAWYEEQFSGAVDAAAIGEASPRYTMYPQYAGVPARIADLLPDIRLIYLVRHPIERMRSHYLDHVIYGAEKAPIEKALLDNPLYLNASRYALQMEQYMPHYPRERLLIIRSEELRHARAPTLRRIHEFLGVATDWIPADVEREFHRTADRRVPRRLLGAVRRLPGFRAVRYLAPRLRTELKTRVFMRQVDPRQSTIPDDLRGRLEEMLRDDVRRLRRYLGDHFDGWGIG